MENSIRVDISHAGLVGFLILRMSVYLLARILDFFCTMNASRDWIQSWVLVDFSENMLIIAQSQISTFRTPKDIKVVPYTYCYEFKVEKTVLISTSYSLIWLIIEENIQLICCYFSKDVRHTYVYINRSVCQNKKIAHIL